LHLIVLQAFATLHSAAEYAILQAMYGHCETMSELLVSAASTQSITQQSVPRVQHTNRYTDNKTNIIPNANPTNPLQGRIIEKNHQCAMLETEAYPQSVPQTPF